MSDETNVDVENVNPDEPAWKSDPTFNTNEAQNYVDPEAVDEE
jgi:hypothetical protein